MLVWIPRVELEVTNLSLAALCAANPFCNASMSESSPDETELLLELDCFDWETFDLSAVSECVFLGFVKSELEFGSLAALRVDSNGCVR
jgi:hypothetical protein